VLHESGEQLAFAGGRAEQRFEVQWAGAQAVVMCMTSTMVRLGLAQLREQEGLEVETIPQTSGEQARAAAEEQVVGGVERVDALGVAGVVPDEGERRGAVGQAVWLRGLEELKVGVTVAVEEEMVVAVVVAAQHRRTRRERIAHVRYRRGGGL
jgi:hypothetical protein